MLWLIQRFLRREIPAFVTLIALILIGTVGYQLLEGMNVVEALYMTTVVISTVGLYIGKQGPLSQWGMLFTVFLIVSGAATAAYFVGVAGQLFYDGEWRSHWKQQWRIRMLKKLQGHAILCGFGRVGGHVADELKREGMPFVVVDPDDGALERASAEGYNILEGDATHEETLQEAGVERAKFLVAALSSDANNVFIVLTARNLNPDLIISARANMEATEPKLLKAGADHVMSPYRIGAHRMVTRMIRPSVADFLDEVMHADTLELLLEQTDLPDNSPLTGKTLAETDLRKRTGVTVLACALPGRRLNSSPDQEITLQPGARLIVLGTREQLEKLRSIARGSK